MSESGVTQVGNTTAAASWIERFFDLSRDLFVVADAGGRVVLANGPWRRVLGYAPGEVIGRPYLDFIHPDDVATTLAAGERLDEGHELPLLETRVICRDGEYRWMRWSATCDKATGVVYAAGRDVTGLKRAGEKLHESRRRLEAVLATAPVILWALDAEGLFTVVEGRGLKSIRGESGSVIGRSVFDVYADAPEVCENSRRALEGETFTAILEVDGRVYEIHYSPLMGPGGEPDGALGVAHDVTDRRRLEDRYRTLVETSDDMIFATDADGRMTFTNRAVEEVLGYTELELEGRPLWEMAVPEQRAAGQGAFQRVIAGEVADQLEFDVVARDGSEVAVSINAVAVSDGAGAPIGVTGIATDITERRRFQRELRHVSDHDSLTGLFNRRRFEEEVQQEIVAMERHGRPGALLVLAIDNFKYVNDTLGHGVGDEVLCAIAALLQRRIRTSDVVGRLAGDEFGVLLTCTTADPACALGRELADAVQSEPLAIGERAVRVTVSGGVTPLGGGEARAASARQALAEADLAMYDAKEAGGDRVSLYSAAGHARMHDHLRWGDRVRAALAGDGFELLAQPIVDVRSGEVVMRELLLRLRGDDGGLIPPGSFLPTAERFGLMPRVDRWVIERAVEHRAAVPDAVPLAVNLSGRSLDDPKMGDFVAAQLARHEVPAEALVLEITEHMAVASVVEARRFAQRLSQLGCGLALDDFGTGFASFHYLKHMPFGFLKIAGDFVREVERRPEDRLLLEAMVRVGRGMGLCTIAEWVEGEATLETLRELGVDCAQGFHLGRPEPL